MAARLRGTANAGPLFIVPLRTGLVHYRVGDDIH